MSFKTPSYTYTSNCFNCNSDFVFWKGRFRYHCRCCGNNFCNDCVQNYCALPHIGILKEVRTCDFCYQKYNNPETEDKEIDNGSEHIFFDSALIPSEFQLENNEDIIDSFENINLDDDYLKVEEENAQCLPVHEDFTQLGSKKTGCSSDIIGSLDEEIESNIFGEHSKTKEESVDDRQLAMALSLSRIDNIFLKYTTSDNTTVLSEEEEIEYALRLSALEEKAKTIVSRLEMPNIESKNMSEDEEMSLALAISKIENEDAAQSLKEETKTNKNANQSGQVHCPICFEERLEYALINCGHVVCGDCKPKLEECPICRAAIRGTIRVYITN